MNNAQLQALATAIATRHSALLGGANMQYQAAELLIDATDQAKTLLEQLGADLVELYGLMLAAPPPGGGPADVVEPFAPSSPYAYLPDVPAGGTFLGFFPPFINDVVGPELELDGFIPPGDYCGQNAIAAWGEDGPKWGLRGHRCRGRIVGVRFHRIGAWSTGREGHGFYVSPARGKDTELDDCEAQGCGANGVQAASRTKAVAVDGMPAEILPLPSETFTLRRFLAVQCGAIVGPDGSRAAWPLSFFNTGSAFQTEDCYVETDHSARPAAPPIVSGQLIGATGALLSAFDQEPRRCPLSEHFDFRAKLTRSDRPVVFLQGADEARLEDLDIEETDRPGGARLRIVDGCGPVRLLRPRRAVLVEFAVAATPHGPPYRTELVPAGTSSWMFGGVA